MAGNNGATLPAALNRPKKFPTVQLVNRSKQHAHRDTRRAPYPLCDASQDPSAPLLDRGKEMAGEYLVSRHRLFIFNWRRAGNPSCARSRSRLALTLVEREEISRALAEYQSIRSIAK